MFLYDQFPSSIFRFFLKDTFSMKNFVCFQKFHLFKKRCPTLCTARHTWLKKSAARPFSRVIHPNRPFQNLAMKNLHKRIHQGYPQRMRLQRRLYGIYTVCFLIFTIPVNCKLVCFFAKSLHKALNYYI